MRLRQIGTAMSGLEY